MDLHAQNDGVAIATLTTARLRLRPLAESDLDRIVELVGDYAVSSMLVPVPHPYTREDAEDFLRMDRAGELDSLWMIEDTSGLVGAISIGTELGYWLGQPYWGRGYMTEAGHAAIAWYFANRDAKVIRSSHFDENDGSRRVLEKLGFGDVGGHVHYSCARKADVPGRKMILPRIRWEVRNA